MINGHSKEVLLAIVDWLKKQELKKKIRREIQGYEKRPVRSNEFGPLVASKKLPQ